MADRNPKGKDGAEVVRVEDIEDLISRLEGVISSRLAVNNWGGIEEVHVLATNDRSPKQIVRDVESTLAARWGIIIDHKKISVAQLSVSETPSWLFRLKLLQLQVSTDTMRGLTHVALTVGNPEDEMEVFSGEARGTHTGQRPLVLACRAATEAMNQAIDPDYRFHFHAATLVHLDGHDLVVCVFSFISPRGSEVLLSGSSLVRNDPIEAAVRASLDAANRTLARFFRRRRKPHRVRLASKKPDEEEGKEETGHELS